MKKFFQIITSKKFWAGAFVLSSAGVVSALPIAPKDDALDGWLETRREIEKAQAETTLSEPIERLLARLKSTSDYRSIMAMSYAVALPEEMSALDAFWTKYLSDRSDNAGFAELMRVRSRALGNGALDRQSYLENWLYLANSDPYDGCGGGTGGNCGVGEGNGGGNGTGNEGNGQGPDRGSWDGPRGWSR